VKWERKYHPRVLGLQVSSQHIVLPRIPDSCLEVEIYGYLEVAALQVCLLL